MSDTTTKLLSSVKNLVYARTLLGRLGWAVFAGLIVGVAILLTGRLTGWMTLDDTRLALFVGPAVVSLFVFLFTRRPDDKVVASEVDQAADAGDLFLTSVTLENEQTFSPLVHEQAATKAAKLEPGHIVGLWDRVRPGWVVAAVAIAVAADLFTPIMDPFGIVEEAEAAAKQRTALRRDAEQVAARKAELASKTDDSEGNAELSPAVQQAMDRLLADIPEMAPKPPTERKQMLRGAQRDLGKLWENTSKKLADQMLSKEASGQRFGGEQARQFNDWKNELKAGKADGLKQEFEDIKELLEQAQQSEPGSEQAKEAMRKAEQKMAALKKFAEDELGAPELAEALEKAMRQMDAAQSPELQQEAMQALSESTELGQMEADALAQASRDMETLQDALETIQQMRQMEAMRGDGEFNPTECEDCQTLSDYAEFYRQQLANMQQGEGTGNEGQGDSEASEEDDSVSTGFKKEVADSYLQKGRMLMSLKGKGGGIQNEDGDREFQSTVQSLEQDALEAVEAENIPPGYRDGIKSYFRSIGEDSE